MAQPERRDWFRIVNKADDSGGTAYIEIFDVIGYDPWRDEGVSASVHRRAARDRDVGTPRRQRTASISRSSITPDARTLLGHESLHCIPPKTNCALIAFRLTLKVEPRRARA
jgi:hypothetical protein